MGLPMAVHYDILLASRSPRGLPEWVVPPSPGPWNELWIGRPS